MKRLLYVSEPSLEFGHKQQIEDPRDGLTLFGPLDTGDIHGIRAGVVGTSEGIARFSRWVEKLQKPIFSIDREEDAIFRPVFPGFTAVFRIPWSPAPRVVLEVDTAELAKTVCLADPHERVYQTADLFCKPILDYVREEAEEVDVWFVIVPPIVKKNCSPLSKVKKADAVASSSLVSPKRARELLSKKDEPSLFSEVNAALTPYEYETDFHDQLKARLLQHCRPVQILQEDTIAPDDFLNVAGYPLRRIDKPSTVAWNLSSAVYYKASGKPWKLSRVRTGVCYLGLVFKQDVRSPDPLNACCAAQMFLDSGDGVVFKGAVGPWYTGRRGDYHLKKDAAKQVVELAIESYRKKNRRNKPPTELFIHGRIQVNDEEWEGFQSAAPKGTNITCIRIRDGWKLKLFGSGEYPIARGMALIQGPRQGYLWTVGYTPRLQTYVGKEVPNPLFVEITRGTAQIWRVLGDVFSLTKLNYNACIFSDGDPVTLKFADRVGEILTAGPIKDPPPLPFKYYI